MCYHASTPELKAYDAFAMQNSMQIKGELKHYFHVSGFERPWLPVTTNQEQNIIQPARWKLIPYWVKTEEEAKKYANTLNAESSEIFEKASYKNFIGKYRGLLWIDGFFEPHKVIGQKETENYYVYKPGKEIFSLGIVIAPWTDTDTGEMINTFSIITVPANELMAEIHNEKKRMPLIVDPADRERWLNACSREEIESFFKPYPDGRLNAHKISTRVTAARGINTNVPETQLEAGDGPPPGMLF